MVRWQQDGDRPGKKFIYPGGTSNRSQGMTAATASEVAAFMVELMAAQLGTLYQDTVAWEIRAKFGDDFVYDNANGNPAIRKDVLDAFNKATGNDVIWSRSGRFWRAREPHDLPGRMQS